MGNSRVVKSQYRYKDLYVFHSGYEYSSFREMDVSASCLLDLKKWSLPPPPFGYGLRSTIGNLLQDEDCAAVFGQIENLDSM